MKLGPTRRPMESLSAYRFRYALFSFKCGIGFALPFVALLAIHPNVNRTSMPLLVMFLYVGLPIGLGMSVLSCLGFIVGGFFARWLENSGTLRWAWLRIQLAVAGTFFAGISLFCLYWLFRGLSTMETQALARGGVRLITSETNPLFFWFSIVGWGVGGIGIPIFIWRRGKAILGK